MKRLLIACGVATTLWVGTMGPAQAQSNGPPDGWYLADTETVRYFKPGETPPGNSVPPGTAGQAPAHPEQAPEGWYLADTETVRYFQPGQAPPKDARVATPAEAAKLAEALVAAGGSGAPSGWYLAGTDTVRYFVPGENSPSNVPEAGADQMTDPADPQSLWHLASTQTIRYWVPGDDPPAGAPASGSEASGRDKPGEEGWFLASTDFVRYFVPGDTPGDNEWESESEELVDSRLIASVPENRQVFHDSKIAPLSVEEMAQHGQEPLRGEIMEAPQEQWALQSSRQQIIDRMVHVFGTYSIPRFQDVRYPYKTLERYKLESRDVETRELTYRYERIRSFGDGIEVRDVDFRKVRDRNEGPWTLQQPIPYPGLDRIRSFGYSSPVREEVAAILREFDVRQFPALAQATSSVSAASSSGRGSLVSSRSGQGSSVKTANVRVQQQMAGSKDAKSKGNSPHSDLIDLAPLAAFQSQVFYGGQGKDVLFAFRLISQGSGHHALEIYPFDASGEPSVGDGVALPLNSAFKTADGAVSGGGISATLEGVQGKDLNLILKGSFTNHLLGETLSNLKVTLNRPETASEANQGPANSVRGNAPDLQEVVEKTKQERFMQQEEKDRKQQEAEKKENEKARDDKKQDRKK